MSKIKKDEFKRVLQALKPALATDNFIETTVCYCFNKNRVYAYDGVMVIQYPFKTGIEGGVEGDSLYKIVNSLSVKEVEISGDSDIFQIKAGRSQFKTGLLPKSKFILESDSFPPDKRTLSFSLTGSFFKGLEKCLVSINDGTPQNLSQGTTGITFIREKEGKYTMYSTDNVSISKYHFKAPDKVFKKAKRHSFTLSKKFCFQILSMKKDLEKGKLVLSKNGDYAGVISPKIPFPKEDFLMASKTVFVEKEVPYEDVIKHNLGKGSAVQTPVSPIIVKALERASIILKNETAIGPGVIFSLQGKVLKLRSSSVAGEIREKIILKEELSMKTTEFMVTPSLALRAFKNNTFWDISPKALLFKSDANHLHLLATREVVFPENKDSK